MTRHRCLTHPANSPLTQPSECGSRKPSSVYYRYIFIIVYCIICYIVLYSHCFQASSSFLFWEQLAVAPALPPQSHALSGLNESVWSGFPRRICEILDLKAQHPAATKHGAQNSRGVTSPPLDMSELIFLVDAVIDTKLPAAPNFASYLLCRILICMCKS